MISAQEIIVIIFFEENGWIFLDSSREALMDSVGFTGLTLFSSICCPIK